MTPKQLLKSRLPQLLLVLLIFAYTVYFAGYTINRHNTLNSYAADLSLIDQPLWNTVRGSGGFMELTWGDRQQPRLAEHFEPILIPLALLFLIWDDVRLLLIAQSLALALGALPVFWIARQQLTNLHSPATGNILPRGSTAVIAGWAALAFALAYLLFPPLQAANVADFHADPFVVLPLLLAFWFAIRKRWMWMWFWAIVAMLTKENLPTLTAMLGLYLIFDYYRARRAGPEQIKPVSDTDATGSGSYADKVQFKHGLGLLLVSLAWFVIATFLIVTPLAREHFGTEGPIYLANRFSGGPELLPELLFDPVRWRYLLGLFAAVGFLPLLAPELLVLGLPVLAANLLSNFPGQYSGEQHYSAPLVVAFILAAIFGVRRLRDYASLRESNGWSLKKIVLIAACLWLLGWSLGFHARRGWTPFSIRTESYRASPAAARLPELLARIPAQAAVSASAALHPHLAHRRVAYVFPVVADADYLLVDVTDIPGLHPNDTHARLVGMLHSNWRLLEADHGLILAEKAPPQALSPPCAPDLPSQCAFFDFARSTASPSQPANLSFGDGRLQLLGYDVIDDPDDGVTFRFYWQTTDTLPDDTRLWPLIYDDSGQLLLDPTLVPMVNTIWYPPSAWQNNEIILTETLPQHLPDSFHLGLAVGISADSYYDLQRRFPVTVEANTRPRGQPGHWVQLASLVRSGPFLNPLAARSTFRPLRTIEAKFGSSIQLTGFWLNPHNITPGSELPVLLQWVTAEPLQTDYTVFVHLVGSDGSLVAQSDAVPTWLTPQATSEWSPGQPVLDRHLLTLPPTLSPGSYTLLVGLYHAPTLERLPLAGGGDTRTLTDLDVE